MSLSKRRIGHVLVVGLMSLVVPSVMLLNQDVSPTVHHSDAPRAQTARPRSDERVDDGTAPRPKPTLVHFDPYFMGGFRNQHMRFVALVAFARKHNITQILLPSLRWIDPYNKPKSIHHELLFDVPHWNSNAERLGLPTLVRYDPNVLEGSFASGRSGSSSVVPCWNDTSSLYSGMNESFFRHPTTMIRKVTTWNMIGQGDKKYSHCRRTPGKDGENNPEKIQESSRSGNSTGREHRFTHLIPHGGLISSGRLWWEYNGLQEHRRKASEKATIDGQEVQMHPEHVPVEKAMYEVMRPSRALRRAGESALRRAMPNATARALGAKRPLRLLALHPRIEQEMLTHKCAEFMESNLTKVFERMQNFAAFRTAGDGGGGYRFDVVFVAVSSVEVERAHGRRGKLGMIMTENRNALRRAREHGLFGDGSRAGIPIFESGTESAIKVQFPRISSVDKAFDDASFDTPASLGVLELVASIINFFTVVDAEIFVGVKGSTFSTDAFSVRYYQRKGEGGGENYIVGPSPVNGGIQRLYGPGPPHACI
ncbi:hypothetical protein ACHAWF_013531 [Thalassiosira exigua]